MESLTYRYIRMFLSFRLAISEPKEYYQELLDEFIASSKNVSEFCMDNGISKNVFYYAKDWMEFGKPKEEKGQNQPKEQKEFVKVTFTEDSVTAYIGES